MGAQRLDLRNCVIFATGHPVASQETGTLQSAQQLAAERVRVVLYSAWRLELRPHRMQERVNLAPVVAGHVVQLATVGGCHLQSNTF